MIHEWMLTCQSEKFDFPIKRIPADSQRPGSFRDIPLTPVKGIFDSLRLAFLETAPGGRGESLCPHGGKRTVLDAAQ